MVCTAVQRQKNVIGPLSLVVRFQYWTVVFEQNGVLQGVFFFTITSLGPLLRDRGQEAFYEERFILIFLRLQCPPKV